MKVYIEINANKHDAVAWEEKIEKGIARIGVPAGAKVFIGRQIAGDVHKSEESPIVTVSFVSRQTWTEFEMKIRMFVAGFSVNGKRDPEAFTIHKRRALP